MINSRRMRVAGSVVRMGQKRYECRILVGKTDRRPLRRPRRRWADNNSNGWRKLHNKELRDLYSSPSIIRIIKSRRMRWAGHVALMGGKEECV
jgi:hypothetical protein